MAMYMFMMLIGVRGTYPCHHRDTSRLTITFQTHLLVDAHARPAHRRCHFRQRGERLRVLDTNYFHISPASLREALRPVIGKYRSLQHINRPLSGDSNFLLVTEQVGERVPDDPALKLPEQPTNVAG